MLYFSYGSNMSSKRLRDSTRVPSAASFAVARLYGHALRFHKISKKDSSGKCDAYKTNVDSDMLFGVLYKIPERDISILDKVEGLGKGYEKKEVIVTSAVGHQSYRAFTYYATNIDISLKPLCWYREHVIRGAEEHSLPSEYIAVLKLVKFDKDTEGKRRTDELSIYQIS